MAKSALTQIDVSQIVIGMTIKLPISWTNHPFFRSKVKIEKASQLLLLKGLDVKFVYLLDGHELLDAEAEELIEDTQSDSLEQPDNKVAARKSIRRGQQRFLQSVNESRNAFSKVVSDPDGAYREIATLVESLMAHLNSTDTPHLTLVGSHEKEMSVTQHGISVAVLSMLIANTIELPISDIRDIALGSMFHDIGKLKVPDNIRRKRGELTEHEANFLKMHPIFGHEMLSKNGQYPKAVMHIVKHHHEFIDGSGYPDGLNAATIPVTTQIVSLVNNFEQLLERYLSPQIALGVLFKSHKQKHDEKLVSQLVKVLGIYPPGTLVRLADGNFAKVMMTTSEVKKPHVWACSEHGEDATLRFLIEEDIDVVEAVKFENLPGSVLKTLQANNTISFYFSDFAF
ncbi:HD-GYP domain-containing protein [Shewanella intestini]|uniref:DUF3391 domain-containing protein n=1 Tax=Shewanella intestini TaxID=2017544 RepID=A0ABS5HYZ9_9GAMM|nr:MULTISPECIES: HD domain-containing phosphohydrolase [Shewanella]MBR9726972.1 DUF3391 domain-containing protein [Shewanella intestini]MRG34462.1 DUF3391 domain-containing protein [Shewanella sp. XMDDZSB0408]